MVTVPSAVVVVAASVCVAAELTKLSNHNRFVSSTLDLLDNGLEPIGVLVRITGLRLTHIRMEVVHDQLVISLTIKFNE